MESYSPRDRWNTLPLPAKRITIPLDRTFSADEMARMQRGLVPKQMEDKWFIYWEDHALHFHRSWTGICLYIARFTPGSEAGDDRWRMIEADINRDPEQYRQTDDEKDAELINFLIDALLLRQPSQSPLGGGEKGAVQNWSFIGRAMLDQHPDDQDDDEDDLGFSVHPPS